MPTFATPEPIEVVIEIAVGDARVTASDRSDTLVVVRPSDDSNPDDVRAAEHTRVEYADGRLVITSQKTWKRYTPFGSRSSIEVVVEAPTGSTLDGNSELGNFRIEGELGTCRLRTAMGNIRLDHGAALHLRTSHGDITVDSAGGDVEATTGSGQVHLGEIRGAVHVKNTNGSTHIDDVHGDVRVRSANGEIDVGRAHASVQARTASGDIRVGEVRTGHIDLETSVGAVDVGIREGTAAWLDVTSRLGRVLNALDASDGADGGNETVEVRARTSIGDIVIRRSTQMTPGRSPTAVRTQTRKS